MMKKFIFLVVSVVVLVLVAGGFFYWWQNQTDVRALNKTLPEGVRVVKSLLGNEYGVINKIDKYEFKIPSEWKGLKETAYMPERTEMEYTGASIDMSGNEGGSRIATIDRFKINDQSVNLKSWAQKEFETFGLVGDFSDDKVGEFEIVKTREEIHLVGMAVYFFKKDLAIYAITNGSEEFIRYIIANGKW